MPVDISMFFAYPTDPDLVAATIESAIANVQQRIGEQTLQGWRESDIAGHFLAEQILARIAARSVLIADITQLNFNVAYEIGFALGRGKRVVLTRHRGVEARAPLVADVGIFDTLGYIEYENVGELERIIRNITDTAPSLRNAYSLNPAAPVYLIDALFRTDSVIRIVSRVKKARLFYRSFDPQESPRLSVAEAFRQVAESYGILLHLLPPEIKDAPVHNMRVAFLAGLAEGFGKVLLVLQDGEAPVPLDYRDLVKVFSNPAQIDEAIADFATRVTEALQEGPAYEPPAGQTLLESISFGASAAENEFRDLEHYYLKTDQYQRALRGEVRLVVGRKGSGKTAIFIEVRDYVRHYGRRDVILDLRPDGYQFIKFKEMVLTYLGRGALEHTVTAFWEYLLLLEVCHKLLEKDRVYHMRDQLLLEPYRKLAALYESDRYVSEGDFSERLSRLLQHITDDYQAKYGTEPGRTLTQQEITELLYRHDVNLLREQVVEYASLKGKIYILFDNLDKGWPTHGLEAADVANLRALLEATRKIERQFERRKIECSTLVFLRNDVYELLVSETPDRGKEGSVVLDWSDPDLLRELLRRRLVHSGMPDRPFSELWRTVCVSHVDGEESSQYLIDRCLMRPRALIDLANLCRGSAVNLGHARIEVEDIAKGLGHFSSDLIVDIGYEIRDVLPAAEDVLYVFIDEPQVLSDRALHSLLERGGIAPANTLTIVDILLWYGVLGVRREDGAVIYIYNVNYSMAVLKGIIRKLETVGVVYVVNPAFVPGLQIRANSGN